MSMTAEQVAGFLRQLPDQVREAVAGLQDDELHWRPEPGEWSVLEVCGHLRDAVDIEAVRLRALLAEEQALLPAFDGIAYARERLYHSDDLDRVLAALRAHCTYVADLVAGLTPEDWERTGRHEEAGPVSVASRAEGLVDHGREHLRQIQDLRRGLAGR